MNKLILGDLGRKLEFRPIVSSASDYDFEQRLVMQIDKEASYFKDKPFQMLDCGDIYKLTNYLLKNFIPIVDNDEELKRLLRGAVDKQESEGITVITCLPMDYGEVVDYCFKRKIPCQKDLMESEGIYTTFAVRIMD